MYSVRSVVPLVAASTHNYLTKIAITVPDGEQRMANDRCGQIDAERRIERELCHGAFDIEGAVDRLSALTHEIRFAAVFVLAEAGPLTVGGIAERTDTHRSEFYYHVTALVDAGLLCALGDGRRPEYRLTDAGEQFVREVFAALEGVAVAETDEPAERRWSGAVRPADDGRSPGVDSSDDVDAE